MRQAKAKLGFTPVVLVLTLACVPVWAASLPYYDDFENIDVGTYPHANGWTVLFSGKSAYVSDTVAHSGTKSFRLDSYPNWAHMDYVQLDEIPDLLTYEVSVYIDPDYGKVAIAGFMKGVANEGPSWNKFVFNATQNHILFQDVDLGPCSPSQWYTVRADLDFAMLTADVWLDGVLAATDVGIYPKEWDHPKYGHMVADKWGVVSHNYPSGSSNVVFFDDVRIEAGTVIPAPSAVLLTTLGLGLVARLRSRRAL